MTASRVKHSSQYNNLSSKDKYLYNSFMPVINKQLENLKNSAITRSKNEFITSLLEINFYLSNLEDPACKNVRNALITRIKEILLQKGEYNLFREIAIKLNNPTKEISSEYKEQLSTTFLQELNTELNNSLMLNYIFNLLISDSEISEFEKLRPSKESKDPISTSEPAGEELKEKLTLDLHKILFEVLNIPPDEAKFLSNLKSFLAPFLASEIQDIILIVSFLNSKEKLNQDSWAALKLQLSNIKSSESLYTTADLVLFYKTLTNMPEKAVLFRGEPPPDLESKECLNQALKLSPENLNYFINLIRNKKDILAAERPKPPLTEEQKKSMPQYTKEDLAKNIMHLDRTLAEDEALFYRILSNQIRVLAYSPPSVRLSKSGTFGGGSFGSSSSSSSSSYKKSLGA